MITDMLEAVVERGTARTAKNALGKSVAFAGKTGSSKDGWFVGYTPNLVTVAWIGFDETEDIGMTGGESALPLWTEFMQKAVSVRPELGGAGFSMPKGVVTIEIDPETGMLADKFCPYREQVVVPSSSSANIHCLRHQPQINETLVAVNNESIETLPETIIVTPENVTVESQNNDTVQYEKTDIKSLPQKNIQPEKINLSEPVKKDKSYNDSKTYLERFEMQNKKRTKAAELN
jgi:membrane peptidoglycan carboxypeptidase